MKKHRQALFTLLAVAVLFVIAIIGVGRLASAYLAQSSADTICPTIGHAYTATILDGTVTPLHTTARLCDSLTIINRDPTKRLVAFGPHDNHIAYDNVTERLLAPTQKLTVTLTRVGTYRFHDHLNDSVWGTFSVARY